MSTQLLLFDALQLGVKTTVLDANDQFLKFKHDGKTEYVKNGEYDFSKRTHTFHTGSWLIKPVTKKILKENGFTVPAGERVLFAG
ncbi:MAG: hypothetical protein U5K84_01270 [Alkalibacterium sp.]|nr:hypothetical protein [Alkalibacterium sp.]